MSKITSEQLTSFLDNHGMNFDVEMKPTFVNTPHRHYLDFGYDVVPKPQCDGNDGRCHSSSNRPRRGLFRACSQALSGGA